MKRIIWIIAVFLSQGDSFSSPSKLRRPLLALEAISTTGSKDRPPCFFRAPSCHGQWTPRRELEDLHIGQELHDAVVVQELLEGQKTGPKVYVDCGVARYKNGKWKLQNAMLRLENSKKLSVAKKRAARLRKKKPCFSVYVSRIRPENDQLEVSLNPVIPDTNPKKRVSIGSLVENQELEGTVMRVEDYGVLVDVGANRHALLHIQSVADALGRYIHKKEGLRKFGLKPGAVIDVKVKSRTGKRVFLELLVPASGERHSATVDEQREAEDEDPYAEEAAAWAANEERELEEDPYAEEAVAWAAVQSHAEEEDDDDDPYAAEAAEWPVKQQEYDEDRDIEDQMGLGTYS